MLFSGSKNANTINCQEAYGIWDLLSANYQFLEKLHVWRNFAHDKDLLLILNTINVRLEKIIQELEKKAKEFSINGPEVGVKDINTSANTEIIRDELIAQDTFIWLQDITELLLRTIRTSTTNDAVRKMIINIDKMNIDMMNNMISYLRIKGWINNAPIYTNIPKNTKEVIDAGEAFHLWDHLTYRYDNIHQTEVFYDLTQDLELKALINIGLKQILQKETAKLEEECLKFGIPLPKKPSSVVSMPTDMQHYFQDDFIFRTIWIGITGATTIHETAIKQSVTNDRIRNFFIELLLSEIEILSRFIRYGKLKGYLNEPPQYALN